MSDFTNLKGVDLINNYEYTEVLKHNILSFLDWSFLNIGAFSNVEIGTSGAYGGDFSRLQPVNDARYTSGTVWEGVRKNWVWESGLEYSTQPIQISGVFVNNTFYSISSNQVKIDYPNGRVIFNNSISLNSIVKVAHSYKWINFTTADEVPWLKRIQSRTFRPDSYITGSGGYMPYSDARIQMPLVAIEDSEQYFKPYEIGSSKRAITRFKFFVIGEDSSVDRVAGIIAKQGEKTIFMFDSNTIASSGAFPLKFDGSKNNNPLTYPDLISNYRDRNSLGGMLTFDDMEVQPKQKLSDNIYQKAVSGTTESVLVNI